MHLEREDQGEDPIVIGLDIGTTSIKGTAFTLDARAVASASVPTITHSLQPGSAYYRPNEFWDAAVTVMRGIVSQIDRPDRIAGIATASMGEAGVLLDAAGEPVTDIIAWFDRRTIPQMDWLVGRLGEERLSRITGLCPQPIFSINKLLWHREHEPEAFGRAKRWLHVADFIAFRLCGVPVTDWSLASRTLAFDLGTLRWSDEVLDAAGIAPAMMAPAIRSGAPIGTVRPEPAAATGLPAGCIVATGGRDLLCGALAAGVTLRGALLDALGEPETVLMSLDHPVADLAYTRSGYDQGAHVAPGMYAIVSPVRRFGQTTGRLGTECNPATQTWLNAGSAPSVERDRALAARERLEPLLELRGHADAPDITVIGANELTEHAISLRASVLRATLRLPDLREPAALGAAILAAMGAGLYIDVADALRQIRLPIRTVAPGFAPAPDAPPVGWPQEGRP